MLLYVIYLMMTTKISTDFRIIRVIIWCFDMKEFDDSSALESIFSELEKGEASAEKEGWIPLEEAYERLDI